MAGSTCDYYDEFMPIECIPPPIILPYLPLKSSQHQSPFHAAFIEFQSLPPPPAMPQTPRDAFITPPPTEGFQAENRDGSCTAPRRRRNQRQRGRASQRGHLAGLPTTKKHRRARILKRCLKKAGVQVKGLKRKMEDAHIDAEEEEEARGQRKSFEEEVLDRMDKIIGQLGKIIKISKCRRPN